MARRFFENAVDHNGEPNSVAIDGSAANLAALHDLNADREIPIVIRQAKTLNNIVEQAHRAIKRVVRPMLSFKAFRCARILLGGIELMHMIAKGQMKYPRQGQSVRCRAILFLGRLSGFRLAHFARLHTLVATEPKNQSYPGVSCRSWSYGAGFCHNLRSSVRISWRERSRAVRPGVVSYAFWSLRR